MTPAVIAEREIRLSFSQANEIHDGLDRAVDALIESAAADANCGILVTRHEPGTYTVALDESVPFGQTHEVLAA
ncbi:hypothetical protein AB0N65_02055 [Paenarthrobacter sp. NPDC089322]|uniref:hypothetical protein n=1 Tax=Paenarthrobacter sp. NPDC089322 TaxID=3155065 RepID=UPI00342DEAE9